MLMISNGFSLMGFEMLGLKNVDDDLFNVYQFEHFEVTYPQPASIIPIAPDGRGNYYCIDITPTPNKNYNIVFWYSNYEYSEDDKPEVTHEDLADFITECIIGWTLEDYDYHGNLRK
jgi:cell wall assembly regulator SMI1